MNFDFSIPYEYVDKFWTIKKFEEEEYNADMGTGNAYASELLKHSINRLAKLYQEKNPERYERIKKEIEGD